METKIKKIKKENNQLADSKKLESQLDLLVDLLVKGQESNSNKLESIKNDLRKGFI